MGKDRRNKFVELFLQVLGETFDILKEAPGALTDIFIKESMQRKILRMGGNNPDLVFKGFSNLKHRKLISRDGDGYKLTKRGAKWLVDRKFKNFRIAEPKWDGKWRVIIFDIPENLKSQRRIFHNKLRLLNFYQLQKSVFVYPFPCEEELGFITGYLKVGDYVDLIIADSVGYSEGKIRKYYDLRFAYRQNVSH